MAFVLVHGGGFTGSCWSRTLPYLEAPARAVDLPGRGARPGDLRTLRVSDWVAAVVEEVKAMGEPVVLVGHSLAGITLPGVAGEIPGRLRRLVLVSCAVPPRGGCVLDILEPEVRSVAERGRETATPGVMDEALARASFCNDMDEALARETLDQRVPESLGPVAEPVSLDGLGQVPISYVRLLRDAILTPDKQDRMIDNLGGAEVLELDAGHMAMISAPGPLAAILNQLHARP